jgi:hypothetical protein
MVLRTLECYALQVRVRRGMLYLPPSGNGACEVDLANLHMRGEQGSRLASAGYWSISIRWRSRAPRKMADQDLSRLAGSLLL